MDLAELRNQIDHIDAEILQCIHKRIEVVKQISFLKKEKDLSIFQPDRELEIVKARKSIAEEFGIPEDLTEEIFRAILKSSRKMQAYELPEFTNVFPGKLHFRKKVLSVKNLDLPHIFMSIADSQENYFLFESLGVDEWSEYSFVGFSPAAILSAKGNDFFVNGKKIEDDKKTPLEQLEAFFEPFSGITTQKSFCGGLIGFMGTEAVQYFDPSVPVSSEKSEFPDFCFGLFLDGLILNRKTQLLEYFYWDIDRSHQIEALLQRNVPVPNFEAIFEGNSANDKEFENMVERMKTEIEAGNIFQIVPSRRFEYSIKGSLLPFYMRLRETNPSPHMYYISLGENKIIGSSPELLARVSGDKIETFPIAGTRSRGITPEEDSKKAAELLSDEKEVAEHMMLVDMARNDLGRVCEYGSVEVDTLMSIKKFSHVQHIVSEVSGILRENVSALRGMMSNFPMGTVCGSPRIEAMKILAREEKFARGPYGGTVGFWSFSGDARFVLAIRSLFVHKEYAFAQAGAGVVYDSVPEHERKEVEKKAACIREILES